MLAEGASRHSAVPGGAPGSRSWNWGPSPNPCPFRPTGPRKHNLNCRATALNVRFAAHCGLKLDIVSSAVTRQERPLEVPRNADERVAVKEARRLAKELGNVDEAARRDAVLTKLARSPTCDRGGQDLR